MMHGNWSDGYTHWDSKMRNIVLLNDTDSIVEFAPDQHSDVHVGEHHVHLDKLWFISLSSWPLCTLSNVNNVQFFWWPHLSGFCILGPCHGQAQLASRNRSYPLDSFNLSV